MRLKRWWCLSRNRVCSSREFTATGTLGTASRGRLKSSRPSTMWVQRSTSLSMISRYSRTVPSAVSPSRASIAATQAPMVASGLLISCMTPAASCPTAASFSLWRMRQLHLARLGHVFADGDDVGDRVAVEPHRDPADPVVAGVAGCLDLDVHLLHFARRERPGRTRPGAARRAAGSALRRPAGPPRRRGEDPGCRSPACDSRP